MDRVGVTPLQKAHRMEVLMSASKLGVYVLDPMGSRRVASC